MVVADGHVIISSKDQRIEGDRGIYNVETGIATLTGSVKITRGDNQLNGARARVNLNTGVSSILGGKQGVRGLLSPRQMGKRGSRTDR